MKPDKSFKKKRKPNKERLPGVFSKEQLVTLLHNTNDSRMAMIIFVGVFQGLRIGEILRLKWKDVDLESGMIWVRDGKNVKRHETGYGKDRCVPINKKFRELWMKWKYYNQDEEFIVPSRFKHRKRPETKPSNNSSISTLPS
ncbi:tyrosine-type recombinase/integrase [Candidatus Woesearchaeota archaeon]|nr:tyrosine-type recombinase/integrase [Candidatus Woesearchaeota archaeon]